MRLSVPVIFITAHDNASIRARIAKSGAAGDLKKTSTPGPCSTRSAASRKARWTKVQLDAQATSLTLKVR